MLILVSMLKWGGGFFVGGMHSVTHWLHQLSFILLAIRQFDIQLLNLLDFYILKGLRLITCGLRLIPYGFSKSFLHEKRSNVLKAIELHCGSRYWRLTGEKYDCLGNKRQVNSKISASILTFFFPMFPFHPPENIRYPKVF